MSVFLRERALETQAVYAATAAEMMRLCWALVLIFSYSTSEGTIIITEPGESITLKCSSEECPKNNGRYVGMYLYHRFTEQNEVYYYRNHVNSKVAVRSRYKGRIESNGAPMNHSITMTNLTVDDSGVYTCVYKESVDKSVECKVYTVFVREITNKPNRELQTTTEKRRLPGGNREHNTTEHPKEPCSRQKALLSTAEERHLPLVLIISISTIILLFIIILILLMIQKARKMKSHERKARPSLQGSNDYVYEVMMKTNRCPAAAPEQPTQNPYELV
ncbi:uncharacterized protein LOC113023260 [Astatotilapia calliptera]|uniref:uncharacterized protein LOC113023260 n=1 Tax=Astatotilapia calliptera TaxID=8154 RepID=UPI000E42576C|nr:uncharacterized protein LOC113023260 [Astatotilapia calliptera]